MDLALLPLLWQDLACGMASFLHRRTAWRRTAWRLSVLLLPTLFTKGRRTVTSWLRAVGVGVGAGYAAYYYFLSTLGRRADLLAGCLLQRALLYVRAKDVPRVPRRDRWAFRTKLELAATLVGCREEGKSCGSKVFVYSCVSPFGEDEPWGPSRGRITIPIVVPPGLGISQGGPVSPARRPAAARRARRPRRRCRWLARGRHDSARAASARAVQSLCWPRSAPPHGPNAGRSRLTPQNGLRPVFKVAQPT
jgi:hypothetical protein